MNENREARPVTREEYSAWSADAFEEKQRVAHTVLGGDLVVSTVFLGVEHPNGMLFETMAKRGDEWLDDSQERYRTWAEAEKGHALTVAALRMAEVTK